MAKCFRFHEWYSRESRRHRPLHCRRGLPNGSSTNAAFCRRRRSSEEPPWSEPLHAAAVGQAGSPSWNPPAQAATIAPLIDSSAKPNAINKNRVSPLQRASRSGCAEAVRTLLEYSADPELRNKNGSTPILLAIHNTGGASCGSPEAKLQQQAILRRLGARAQA